MKDSISAPQLKQLIEGGANIRVFDVRLEEDRVDVEHPVPTAEWRNPEQVSEWCKKIDQVDEVIVYCVHGHHVSQSTRNALRDQNIKARIVEGGIEGWCEYIRGLGENRG